MQSNQRETILKMAAGAIIGLFLLDRMVFGPAVTAWKDQSERLAALEAKVLRGRQLLERDESIRSRWKGMVADDLSEDSSSAENDVFKAISRWTRDSRVSFNSLTPQWRTHDEGYDTFECRATATGDQASLARLLYEIESDKLPARVEDCEFASRDTTGRQLSLTVRFSFLRLNQTMEAPR